MSGLFESDSDEETVVAAAAFVLMGTEFLRKAASMEVLRKPAKSSPPLKETTQHKVPVKRKRGRRYWLSTLNKSRQKYSATDMLAELKNGPSGSFENFCGMSAMDFEHLMSRIGPLIAKEDTVLRQSIPVQERFAAALRYFATGDSFHQLSYVFRFSNQTVSRSVDEVCKAIMQELKEEIKLPETEDEWLAIAQDFQNQWNFPNCLGAIEVKRVTLPPPNNTVHKDLSMVLLALVDARNCFTFVDIESQDQVRDMKVITSLYTKLQNGEWNLPTATKPPGFDKVLPHVFLGGSTFPLSHHIIRPYPDEEDCKERCFNYRFSHARRVVDNAFGAMTSAFQVLSKPVILQTERIRDIMLTCILLHNYLSKSKTSSYAPPGTFYTEEDQKIISGLWREDGSELTSLWPVKEADKKSQVANAIRDSFAEFFDSSGKSPRDDEPC